MLNRSWPYVIFLAFTACAQPSSRPGGGDAPPVAADTAPAVVPAAETPPVDSPDDAADDPAIWVHPEDPSLSLVIGTDKQRGLLVYDLDARLLQMLPDGHLNNVDLRDGFRVEGRETTLVAASNRTSRSISLYFLDAVTRRLVRAGDPVPTGFADPYGLCMYADAVGRTFVFVNDADTGRFRQWRIRAEGGNLVAERVREFRVGSQAEGCAADDETGALYVAEEDGGFWRYSAESDGGNDRREIDRVGGATGLIADIEGVAIWQGIGGRGFVVLSNQGANSYAVYRRDGDNAFVGLFRVGDNPASGIDGVSATDGLAVTSRPLSARYPKGLLVIQDGNNQPLGQHQNFKYVSWDDLVKVLGLPEQD